MNKKIADIISRYLTEETETLSRIKIQYYIESVLGEVEKTIIIVLLFSMLGSFVDIVIILSVLLLLRPYIGGTHFNTYISCLVYSIAVCTIICIMHNFFQLYNWVASIFAMMMLMFIVIYAPVKSRYRPVYQGKRLVIIKVKGMVALCSIIIMYILFRKHRNVIVWSGFVVLIDALVACIRNGGSILRKEEIANEEGN